MSNQIMNNDVPQIQSVKRVFDVLETLAKYKNGASLRTISEETHLAKSTTHRMLANLINLGYIVQSNTSFQYRLTLKMFEISSNALNGMDIFSESKQFLDQLALKTGETIHLSIQNGTDCVYIYKAESTASSMASRLGARFPMFCTAMGKAILSTLPEYEVRDIWNNSTVIKHTPKTNTDLNVLLSQLNEIRTRGYAIDDEENEVGVRCIGFPLSKPGLRATAAFSLSGFTSLLNEERLASYINLSQQTQRAILCNLGIYY